MARGKIKGITVEIGGNTSKLNEALAGSEKRTRSLQYDLKDIQKLLKFDPTNVELLTQKQGTLADMIESTSEKLDKLKEAEKQVIAQFERGEIAEDQLRAFQREIIKCEKDLDGMKKELSATDKALQDVASGADTAEKHTEEYAEKLKEAEDNLKDFGDSARDAYDTAKTGALALGGAMVAGAGYALKMSTEFDQAFNTLQTRTGATKEEMDGLDEAMKNVYSNNFGESIQDVAESMATVKTNTKLSGAELENITERALLLRDTFEFDVNESTRTAKMLMDQYGMSAEEAYNLIAQGAQNGLDKNGDLLDTINEYGVHFNGLGLSAEDMFNMLVNGAENGTFSVDKLGDAVKEFGIRVKDGTADNAFKELGFDIDQTKLKFAEGGEGAKQALQDVTNALFSMEDPVKQNQLGVEMFGTMWEDLGVEGVKALMNLEGEVSNSKKALDEINQTKYDDIGSALQGLGRTLQTDLVDPLGDELKPVVEDAIGYVQDNGPQIKEIISQIVSAVGEFVGFVVNNGSTILSIIAGIGGAFLLWNVVTMITSVVGAISSLFTLIKGGTAVMTAFNMVLNANPIGILVTLIGGLIIALVTFFATNEDARAKVVEIWNNIKEVASNVFGALVTFFTETVPNAISGFVEKTKTFFTNIIDFVKNNWQSLLLMLVNPFAGAFALLYENCEGFRNFVNGFVESVKNFFINAGNNIVNFFTTTIPNLISNIVSWFTSLPEKIGYAIGFILGKFIAWHVSMFNWIATNVPILISKITTFFSELPGKIWNFLVTIVTNVVTWGKDMKKKATDAVKSLITSVVSFMKQLPGKIATAISGAISRITTWGNNMKSKATSAIKTLVSNVVSQAKTLPGKIYDAIKGAVDKIATWGVNMKNKAVSAIKNVATAIKDGLKSIPNTVSSIGKNIVEGLWKGISGATTWIKNKVGEFAKSILKGMKDALGIKSPSRVFRDQVGKYIAEGIGVGITDNEDKPIGALGQLTKDMLDSTSDINGVTLNRQLNTTFAGQTRPEGSVADLVDLVSEYMPKLVEASKKSILLDGKTLVGETIGEIDARLSKNYTLRARGV